MDKIEFQPVAFTERDYLLLLDAEQNAFYLSLPAVSDDDSTMTVDGRHCNVVLSQYLFDKIMTTQPADASSFIGTLIGIVDDYKTFLALCRELICKNMMLATTHEVKNHLFDMEGRLSHYLLKLDNGCRKPLIEGCKECYDSFMDEVFNECSEIKLLPLKQQKARYTACLHKVQACSLGRSWKIKGLSHIISELKSDIKEVEIKLLNEEDPAVWSIENEPHELAMTFAKLFHALHFYVKPGKPAVEHKEFVERMLLNFRDRYHCPFDKPSMYVMFCTSLKNLGHFFKKN